MQVVLSRFNVRLFCFISVRVPESGVCVHISGED